MAMERKGAKGSGGDHRNSRPRESKHGRPPPHFFMSNERIRQQCPTMMGDLSTSINAHTGANT
jgi:hypothetical protein